MAHQKKNPQPNQLETSNVLDSIAIPTFAINTEHEITHWNRAIEKASGLSAVEMIGTKNQWKPFYPNPRPTMSDLIVEGARDESVERFYTNKYHKSSVLDNAYEAEDFFPAMGSGEWLSFTAAPIIDDNNNMIGAVETLFVISDRKHAEQKLIDSQQKYRELSTIDDLTKLFNARHFFEQVSGETDRCNRYSQSLSLCLFDLDNFKIVNDTYGHQFGNTVLEEFAKIIKKNIRHVDMAFRYGGEEFVVLFPFVIAHHAAIVVEKICLQLAQADFTTDDGEKVKITTSAGLSTYIIKEDKEEFIKRADKAMYQSKDGGKNKITIAN
ncbi:MAG: diguanylate cyclase [Cycloclasticus sp. symbiont of Bathymodiolus heckerae]|nr:MAG: diguanylate cyclase [Cycloclasticus sp. symbiont of Bathymodiolus heckerae]